ncbi:MarR family transcriptional regulator [Iamia majanohamensis]|uniref:MarR family transcriptional regulator n=1 Tax=Iamia majanohamensis TaxID=467976 RepID=A0AAE9YA13_9ACTN|nr:MarR family transcriptional regulator [Iamia majanohamensis]WCO65147.1 MarR family transcriptional regulator [Iamia majanohamensis]
MQDDAIATIEGALITLVRRANDPRGNREMHRTAGADIERAGAVMLARVEEHEPARLSVLADAAGVEVSTASRQVARLVEEGYVSREPDPDDRRASAHRLTPAGRDLRRRLAAARRAWLEGVLADFDADDVATFAHLLGRFVDEVEAAHLASEAR